MKKICIFLAIALASCTGVIKAQNYGRTLGSELSIGIDGALPLGGWDSGDGNGTKVSSFGIGATAKYAYNFNERFAATFQTGYIYFPGKDLGGGKINMGQIPIKAGLRISSNAFYFEPQLGISSLNVSVKDDAGSSVSGSTTAFTYAIGVGVMASSNFDIGLRYEAMSKDGTTSFLGLRFAYSFPLK